MHIIFLVPGIMSPHYSIEYRKHFTNVHITVVGWFGATEELLIHMLVYLYAAVKLGENAFEEVIHVFPNGYEFTPGKFICVFTLITGLHYNLENFYYGFKGAKDKCYALMCFMPLILTYVMLFACYHSHFYLGYCLWFYAGIGLFLTYATASLNISSTSST